MTKYRIYDTYEGEYDLIGIAENESEMKKIIREYAEECDNECYLIIQEYIDRWTDEFNNKYKLVKDDKLYRCHCICKNDNSMLYDFRKHFVFGYEPSRQECENLFVDAISRAKMPDHDPLFALAK